MMNIKTTADLNAKIALLEVDVSVKKNILTEQYHATCESLRPVNIIKNAFNRIVDSGDLADKIIGTSVGYGAGVLSKKILIGKSTNIFKRVFGTVIELAITNAIAKNSEGIKEKGLNLLRKFTNNHDHHNQK
jgi:hypothetical protein